MWQAFDVYCWAFDVLASISHRIYLLEICLQAFKFCFLLTKVKEGTWKALANRKFVIQRCIETLSISRFVTFISYFNTGLYILTTAFQRSREGSVWVSPAGVGEKSGKGDRCRGSQFWSCKQPLKRIAEKNLEDEPCNNFNQYIHETVRIMRNKTVIIVEYHSFVFITTCNKKLRTANFSSKASVYFAIPPNFTSFGGAAASGCVYVMSPFSMASCSFCQESYGAASLSRLISTFQMCWAYSDTDRSLENLPEHATPVAAITSHDESFWNTTFRLLKFPAHV